MVNYQQGKIYKIECNATGKVYIGSTCKKTLAERLSQHRSSYNSYLDGRSRYMSSFEIIEEGDYTIILIELYPCDSKDELFSRERFWTNQIVCINKIKNQGLQIELGQQQYSKQHNQIYYQANKTQILEKQKDFYKENKNKINESTKKYYIKNNERILQQCKQYRESNRDKILEKHDCEICGGKYVNSSKARHLKSKKHIEKMLEAIEK